MKRLLLAISVLMFLTVWWLGMPSRAALTTPPHSSPASTSQATDFYLIFASDPQYPWTDQFKKDANGNFVTKKNSQGGTENIRVPEDRAGLETYSAKLNRDHVKSMQAIVSQLGAANFRGVVINGDLTNFGHAGELDTYKQIYDQSGLKIYPGLGNHDYANNVDDCAANQCATRMVKYMHGMITKLQPAAYDFRVSAQYYKFPQLRQDYTGSLSYAWDIGDVHLIQLHNYPAYTRSWNGYDAAAARRDFVEITSSMNWLRADLTKARNEGKKIIVNMHDCGDHFYKEHRAEYDQFVQMVKEFNVSAVFAGHIHADNGFVASLGDHSGVPLFRSGASSYSSYLLARFSGNNLIVEKVSSQNGAATRSAVGTYPLKTNRPSAPVAVVEAKKGQITFFNEGGYVAKYSLTYVVNGQPVVQNTGNLALGNRVSYPLPSNATNIAVKGEAKTGLAWAPWKIIFSQAVASVSTTCFKSYGTTLNPKWSYCQ